jgi:hypothetical protein
MDEREADHLRRCIRELERANRRWKAVAVCLAGVLAVVLFVGSGTFVGLGLWSNRRMAAETEQLEAERARQEAESQAQRAREAELRARPGGTGRIPNPIGQNGRVIGDEAEPPQKSGDKPPTQAPKGAEPGGK